MTVERHEGPTPNGGSYSVAYYLTSTGQLIDKSLARRIKIEEYDADDNLIWRTYGFLTPQPAT